MNGPEHYIEAERLAALADSPNGASLLTDGINCAALAQVHATLVLAAATAEGAPDPASGPLVRRPIPKTPTDPAYPGNEWGRAIYGEVSS